MAIKGMTDRQTLKPALPRLGRLRKGGEKTNPKKPGPDLDYFRFTSKNPEIVTAFHNFYGDTPRLINVVIFQDTTEEAFPSWIEAWDASGMVFRSDGNNWLVWREGSQYVTGKKPHEDHPDQFDVGRLEVLIPELLQQGFVGTVTMETHGNHDLRNITSVLYAAERERGGSLRGAQFILKRVEEEISVPGWGDRSDKRSKAKKWLVKLATPRRLFDNLLAGGEQKQLAAPVEELKAPDWGDVEPVEYEQLQSASGDAPDVFKSLKDALDWGMKSGVFNARDHAKRAYNKLKADNKPETAKEMRDLWVNNVQERIALKAQPGASPEAQAATAALFDDDQPDTGYSE